MLCAALFAATGAWAQPRPRFVHVFVALADNVHQGIVPVPAALGNGDDAPRNLYWGAAFGMKTFFRRSADWETISEAQSPSGYILASVLFRHRASGTLLLADAYRGSEIRRALTDFFRAAAGIQLERSAPRESGAHVPVPDAADLVAYIGHDGLMDFSLSPDFRGKAAGSRPAIILACASRAYFSKTLQDSGADPLLWTTGLMAPEAYTLHAALEGWIAKESKVQIRQRAAAAYARYQKCSLAAALRLFSSAR